MTNDVDNARSVRASGNVREKLSALKMRASHLPQHVRLASTHARVCVSLSGEIRQSRRTQTSVASSDPPGLTAPHCVQKNKFSWPCNRASSWLTCMIPGNFSSVRGASGCATSLRFASPRLHWRIFTTPSAISSFAFLASVLASSSLRVMTKGVVAFLATPVTKLHQSRKIPTFFAFVTDLKKKGEIITELLSVCRVTFS